MPHDNDTVEVTVTTLDSDNDPDLSYLVVDFSGLTLCKRSEIAATLRREFGLTCDGVNVITRIGGLLQNYIGTGLTGTLMDDVYEHSVAFPVKRRKARTLEVHARDFIRNRLRLTVEIDSGNSRTAGVCAELGMG